MSAPTATPKGCGGGKQVAEMGVEPICPLGQGILSPQRLPFRHSASWPLANRAFEQSTGEQENLYRCGQLLHCSTISTTENGRPRTEDNYPSSGVRHLPIGQFNEFRPFLQIVYSHPGHRERREFFRRGFHCPVLRSSSEGGLTLFISRATVFTKNCDSKSA